MRRRSWLAAALVLAASGGVRGLALAADATAPSMELSVIHALRTDGGASIDPELRDLPQLTKEKPFVRYNVYRLLERRRLPLQKGRATPYVLVDGRTLQITLIDVAGAASDLRYHIRAEIAGPDKKEFLKLLEVTAGPNDPFFVGGQSYAGGTLFLELTLRTG